MGFRRISIFLSPTVSCYCHLFSAGVRIVVRFAEGEAMSSYLGTSSQVDNNTNTVNRR